MKKPRLKTALLRDGYPDFLPFSGGAFPGLFRVFIVLSFGALLSTAGYSIENEDCFLCHDTDLDPARFAASIHGELSCVDCHEDVEDIDHPEKLNPVDCGDCHFGESRDYLNSAHGEASQADIVEAPSCLSCHGDAHAMPEATGEGSPVSRSAIPETCARCHGDEQLIGKFGLMKTAPQRSYARSVHGEAAKRGNLEAAVCTDCHGSHLIIEALRPESKLYWRNIPSTCGKCHTSELEAYLKGVHGEAAMSGSREAPVCTDCHGEHDITSQLDPLSRTYSTALSIRICAQCHAAERISSKFKLPSDRVKTYLASYHGLASQFGSILVANCASCHGSHEILPSSDPRSLIYKDNLATTCGKCHIGLSDQILEGSIHLDATAQQGRIIYYITVFYVVLIAMVIGGMVVHNVIDFRSKLKTRERHTGEAEAELRFTLNERSQHWTLALSFLVLAYSGFALKFPAAWWAAPFSLIRTGNDWRGIVHRAAAVIFVALTLYHLYYIAFTDRGRRQIKALWPARKDFRDVRSFFRKNRGAETEMPETARFNYAEKLEYWALVWGSLIMIATGACLAFNSFGLRHLPKWLLDVAAAVHYYEAVLATLAILVWHFYFVIFDPKIYPMDKSMLTGKDPRQTMGADPAWEALERTRKEHFPEGDSFPED